MSYTPINLCVYLKAFAGALSGMGSSGRNIPSLGAASYYALMADAYAQEFDATWGETTPTGFEEDSIEENSEAVWENGSPLERSVSLIPGSYNHIVVNVIALVQAGNNQIVAQGVDPNGCNGGEGAAFYQTILLDGNPQSPQRPNLNFASHIDDAREIASGQFNSNDDPDNSATMITLETLYLCVSVAGGGVQPIIGQVSIRVDTAIAPTTVEQQVPIDQAWDGMRMRVKDSTGHAQTNNITVTVPSGWTIENPYSLGTYGATAVINTKGAGFEWELNQELNQMEMCAQ